MTNEAEKLRARILRYAKVSNRLGELDLESPLGAGTDGYVWRMSRTAVKVFYREANYLAELECYERLRARFAPDAIAGFWVPKLIANDAVLMIIEMQLVSPPFLIDFGKAYLDRTPRQIPGISTEEVEELFEDKAPRVLALLRELKLVYGIYYLDPRPGNIMFGDEWD
jgi:hypothetical protein